MTFCITLYDLNNLMIRCIRPRGDKCRVFVQPNEYPTHGKYRIGGTKCVQKL